ncbi:hypothetical protein OIU35_28945 [Boseaceae bacterium BT-24-1]|nr:hypothetical protein [Boseaceae bacterium BT-24-1]
MKLRSSKAAGSFSCAKHGSFELLINIEADPLTYSFCEFDFHTELPGGEADQFSDLAAYFLRHQAGRFVICAEPHLAQRSPQLRESWTKLDSALAQRGTWLFPVDPKKLRREPEWQNALELARCAQIDIDIEDEERVREHMRRVGRCTIREVMKLCRASSDSFDAILKLIVSGVLVCEDEFELSPRSRVGAMSPHSQLTSVGWL